MNILEIENARKEYPSFTLDNVNLTLPAGYIMGLIGPNGAGKTTLIKLIMNVVRLDGGSIRMLASGGLHQNDPVRERIGFVQDLPTFYGHLSLAKMQSIYSAFYPRWDQEAFLALSARFQLPLSSRVSTLSRGMTTRFALSLALSHQAELLILDEPTTGLDPASRRELLAILADYIGDGTRSVLFSTHITSDLDRAADFVTLMQAGTTILSATQDEISDTWFMIKGGNRHLNESVKAACEGWHLGPHGFEALTRRRDAVCQQLGDEVLVEQASLDEIMFFTTPRNRGRKCTP